jgi:multidrug efflux pump subunit AcrA (membrane-fusion protein)
VDWFSFLTSYKQVTAPYKGVITDRPVDIGDLVTTGSTTNATPLTPL